MNLPSIPSLPSLPSMSDLLSGKVPDNMKTMTVTLRHVLIVSHAVPVGRVRNAVPAEFDLDTLKVGGETCAIVQATCVFNDNFHYTPLPMPSLDFWQSTYRVLTRHAPAGDAPTGDAPASDAPASATATAGATVAGQSAASRAAREPSAYVFRTFLGTRVSWAVQRAVASGADYADFNVITRGANERGEYSPYVADIHPSDDTPSTQMAFRTLDSRVPAPPFASWDRMAHFLTHRPLSYQQWSVGGHIAALPMEHAAMNPVAAELVPVGGEVREARFGVWEKMGLMNTPEMRNPFSILIQPSLTVTVQAPRLVKTAGEKTGPEAAPASTQ